MQRGKIDEWKIAEENCYITVCYEIPAWTNTLATTAINLTSANNIKVTNKRTKYTYSNWWIRILNTLLLTKNPWFSRTPKTFFQANSSYFVYTVWQYNPSQNVHHKLQRNCLFSTQQEYFIYLFTHGVLYIKGMLVKLNHRQIPGLSRTLNLNFHDFPWSNSFFGTLQVLEISGKMHDFPGGVGTLQKDNFLCKMVLIKSSKLPYHPLSLICTQLSHACLIL